LTTTSTDEQEKLSKHLPVEIGKREKVIPFDEAFKYPGTNRLVTFDGPQFQEWVYKTLPVSRDLVPLQRGEAAASGISVGDFRFYLLKFPMYHWGSRFSSFCFGLPALDPLEPILIRSTLEVYRNEQHGNCGFSTPVNIPVLAKPERHGSNMLKTWMSLTPNEVLTQRGQIRRTKKNTAMAGLGLGWAARKVLERKQVDHLTVYEQSQEIIDYFGASLLQDYPDKVTLICADAYEVDWTQFDVSIWDIWAGKIYVQPGVFVWAGDRGYENEFEDKSYCRVKGAIATSGSVND
jgi:hypothetical protein